MISIGAMLEPSSPILKLLGAKMRCKSENIGSSANSTEFSKTRLSFLRGPRCGPRANMMILLKFFCFKIFSKEKKGHFGKYSKRPKMRSKSKNDDFV